MNSALIVLVYGSEAQFTGLLSHVLSCPVMSCHVMVLVLVLVLVLNHRGDVRCRSGYYPQQQFYPQQQAQTQMLPQFSVSGGLEVPDHPPGMKYVKTDPFGSFEVTSPDGDSLGRIKVCDEVSEYHVQSTPVTSTSYTIPAQPPSTFVKLSAYTRNLHKEKGYEITAPE